jgi:hypothetical protein
VQYHKVKLSKSKKQEIVTYLTNLKKTSDLYHIQLRLI